MRLVETIYLGMGSNLGDRKMNLRRALKLLPPRVKIEYHSPVYETEPMYLTDQPKFYNIVVRAKTAFTPLELLKHIQSVERKMGRPLNMHNRPRVIDIDILFYGQQVIDESDLTIPHPRIPERAFVLVPLADVAPTFMHPVLKVSMTTLLGRLQNWEDSVKETNVRV